MIAHPAIFWAKFYLSRRTHSYAGVMELLKLVGLPGLAAEDLEHIDKGMIYPVPFLPKNIRHAESQKFLRTEGIVDAWHQDKAMRRAVEILGTKKFRGALETIVLSPLRRDRVLRKMKEIFPEERLDERVLDLFCHYFWNSDFMGALEWGEFFEIRQSIYTQWHQLALDSRSPGGLQTLLWKMGAGGTRGPDTNKAFTDARNVAYYSIMQIAAQTPSEAHSRMLLNYARAMKVSQEGMDSSTDAQRDTAQAFSLFRLRHNETPSPSIQQLTEGNFSESTTDQSVEEDITYD